MRRLLKLNEPAIAVILKKNLGQTVQPGAIIFRTLLQEPFFDSEFRVRFAGDVINRTSLIQCFQRCL
jgi:hypothetical protein